MFCHITNVDGSMFVHEVRGVVFVTWVSKQHKEEARKFRADNATDWAELISEMTGIECVVAPNQSL